MSKTNLELLAEKSGQTVAELESELLTNPYLRMAISDMEQAREDERARMREVIMLYRTYYGDIITYLLNELK